MIAMITALVMNPIGRNEYNRRIVISSAEGDAALFIALGFLVIFVGLLIVVLIKHKINDRRDKKFFEDERKRH